MMRMVLSLLLVTACALRGSNLYRREVKRLIAEGLEERFVLIKGETILGIFASWKQARQTGLRELGLVPFFVHQIRSEEPVFRLRGYELPCPS